jgi:arylformamidase
MVTTLKINNELKTVDLSQPIDISIEFSADEKNPLAWYLDKPEIEPVQLDDWVGSIVEGAAVNFKNILFNPHAHGTHTECVGHISNEFYAVNASLKEFFFLAEVISVIPENKGKDQVITGYEIKKMLHGKQPEAVVIRTFPNTPSKKSRKYSNTNWPYLSKEAAQYLHDLGVQHLLIDLPSVDKEKDDGKLHAHKAFWNYPEQPRLNATITEFIFVPNKVKDGSYLLNLQMANFKNDAAPSRPVLYKFK